MKLDNYKKALKGQKRVFAEESFHLGHTYHGLGNVYLRKKEHERALECYRKAIDVLVGFFPSDYAYFANIHTDMGIALRECEKYDEAIGNFEQALNILIQNYGIGHQNIVPLKKDLQLLYQKQGKFEQLRKLEKLNGFLKNPKN